MDHRYSRDPCHSEPYTRIRTSRIHVQFACWGLVTALLLSGCTVQTAMLLNTHHTPCT